MGGRTRPGALHSTAQHLAGCRARHNTPRVARAANLLQPKDFRSAVIGRCLDISRPVCANLAVRGGQSLHSPLSPLAISRAVRYAEPTREPSCWWARERTCVSLRPERLVNRSSRTRDAVACTNASPPFFHCRYKARKR